jgi:hypothetical protein
MFTILLLDYRIHREAAYLGSLKQGRKPKNSLEREGKNDEASKKYKISFEALYS